MCKVYEERKETEQGRKVMSDRNAGREKNDKDIET